MKKTLLIILMILLCSVYLVSAQVASSQLTPTATHKRMLVASDDLVVAQAVDVYRPTDELAVVLLTDEEINTYTEQGINLEEDIEFYSMIDTVPASIVQIGASESHLRNIKGNGIKVAVLDTGIDYNNPDLAPVYAGGKDFVHDDNDPLDDGDHGTFVSGALAAALNDDGIVGTAPEVELYALKVLNSEGAGFLSDLLAALSWAEDNDIDIVTMSLGSSTNSPSLQQALIDAYAAGILLIAASGNDPSTMFFPALYETVIAVGAVDSGNTIASFSSRGIGQEIVAPGVEILTTGPGNQFFLVSGTSMAAPHIAGSAALLMGLNPELSHVEVRNHLTGNAIDLGTPGYDTTYGYGLVNASFFNATPAVNDTLPPNSTNETCTPLFESINSTCQSDDTFLEYFVNTNNCTGAAPANITHPCDYCTPSFQCNSYTSCQGGFQSCNGVLDLNGCFGQTGLFTDQYHGNFSEFGIVACAPNTTNETQEENKSITFHSPLSQIYTDRKIPLFITYTGFEEIHVELDGRRVRNRVRCDDCPVFNATLITRSGTHLINATGRMGNMSIEETVEFVYERKGPRILRQHPRRGKYYQDPVLFSVEFSPDAGIVSGVDLYLEGEGLLTPLSLDTESLLEHCREIRKRPQRLYCEKNVSFGETEQEITYWFNVTGAALVSQSRKYSFHIDNIPPRFFQVSPQNGSQFERSIPFDILLSERVDLSYSDNGGRFRRLCSNCIQYDRKKSFSRGNHTITLKAIDEVGHMQTQDLFVSIT